MKSLIHSFLILLVGVGVALIFGKDIRLHLLSEKVIFLSLAVIVISLGLGANFLRERFGDFGPTRTYVWEVRAVLLMVGGALLGLVVMSLF